LWKAFRAYPQIIYGLEKVRCFRIRRLFPAPQLNLWICSYWLTPMTQTFQNFMPADRKTQERDAYENNKEP
jgi:hypothetical protein